MQHKADGYILSCIEPYGRCAMTSPLGVSDPHQAAKRTRHSAGDDIQAGQRYSRIGRPQSIVRHSRIGRPQSIVRRTHQHGPG